MLELGHEKDEIPMDEVGQEMMIRKVAYYEKLITMKCFMIENTEYHPMQGQLKHDLVAFTLKQSLL